MNFCLGATLSNSDLYHRVKENPLNRNAPADLSAALEGQQKIIVLQLITIQTRKRNWMSIPLKTDEFHSALHTESLKNDAPWEMLNEIRYLVPAGGSAIIIDHSLHFGEGRNRCMAVTILALRVYDLVSVPTKTGR